MTLTNSPERSDSFEGKVKACPFCFDDPEKQTETPHGASAEIGRFGQIDGAQQGVLGYYVEGVRGHCSDGLK